MIYCTEPWAFKAFTSYKFANLVNLTNVIWMVTSPSTSSTVACSTVDYQMFFSLSIYASCSYFHFANGVNIKREFVQRKKNRKPVWIKIRNCRINKTSKRRSQRFEKLVFWICCCCGPGKARETKRGRAKTLHFHWLLFVAFSRPDLFYSPSRFHSPRLDLGLHFKFLPSLLCSLVSSFFFPSLLSLFFLRRAEREWKKE